MPLTLPDRTLIADLAALQELAEKPMARSPELVANLRDLYQRVFAIDFGAYDPVRVREEAPLLIAGLFDLRVALRDRIPDWQARGLLRQDAQVALRDCLRITRYASDLIGELMAGYGRLAPGENAFRAFSGQPMTTLVNQRFDTGAALPFQSGDVVLVRGTRHNSAAIARIGAVDSQFSHVGLVYVDGQGAPHMVEALIEEGSVVTPLETALQHGLGRAMLFRPRDPELAARAAALIHDRVQRALNTGGAIPYDFSMLLKSYRRLFCSKLVREAYDKASAGKLVLPTFPSRFNANRDFYRRVGVKAGLSFTPGDMEIEPQFDLVAEWQDYRVTPRLRMQDMMMTKLFEWMEHRDWRFREDWPVFLVSVFGRLSTRLSDRARVLLSSSLPKIPPHMRRRTIATVAMLHQTAEPLLARLEALEAERIATTGRPLHPREVLAWLETERRQSNGRIGYLVGPRSARTPAPAKPSAPVSQAV